MKLRSRFIVGLCSLMIMFVGGAVAHAQTQTDPLGILNQRDTAQIPLLPNPQAPRVTQSEMEFADVAWGPGREIQAGLRVRMSGGAKHNGLFIFEVCLRNRTNRTVSVQCPSYPGITVPEGGASFSTEEQSPLIYCTPILQDSRNKAVPIEFHQGTEERTYALKPNQVVVISHWMLRTVGPQSKASGRRIGALVAEVEPGKCHVACDVGALWDGQRQTLRTERVRFDVQKADVGED